MHVKFLAITPRTTVRNCRCDECEVSTARLQRQHTANCWNT